MSDLQRVPIPVVLAHLPFTPEETTEFTYKMMSGTYNPLVNPQSHHERGGCHSTRGCPILTELFIVGDPPMSRRRVNSVGNLYREWSSTKGYGPTRVIYALDVAYNYHLLRPLRFRDHADRDYWLGKLQEGKDAQRPDSHRQRGGALS